MLAPETRTLLSDSLRPPDGFHVDTAVATAYSADLTALLLAPLSFALHEYDAREAETVDPIQLLESVRRYADHTTLFCQAARLAVPSVSHRVLLPLIEDAVHEVKAPVPDRVFHPKVWMIRFTDGGGRRRHRLLCGSRNLTFDRSWDTLLRLDEHEDEDNRPFPDTTPLVSFLTALPSFATRPLSEGRLEQIHDLAGSLERARFACPPGVDELTFLPLGLPGTRPPAWGEADRVLAISAFLDAATVAALAAAAPEGMIVSRPESFDALASEPVGMLSPYTLQRAAEVPVGDDVETPERAWNEASDVLEGLHAKTFVLERGDRARIITGSANATVAGFSGNVEFDVEMSGPRADCGISAMWDGTAEAPGLSRLMQSYTVPDRGAPRPATAATEWLVDQYHTSLAAAAPTMSVSRLDGDQLSLTWQISPVEPVGITRLWPVTLPRDGYALPMAETVAWKPVGMQSVTAFVVVETTAGEGASRCTRTGVLTVELRGDPPERRSNVLRDVLRSKADVLRYLVFLLGDPAYDEMFGVGDGVAGSAHFGGPAGRRVEIAVFESLVRAAAHGDASLDRVARLLSDLEAGRTEDELIPDGFNSIWHPVWQAHKEAMK